MEEPLASLRRRTLLGGILIWVVFVGSSVAALVTEGVSRSLLVALVPAFGAGIALAGVRTPADVHVAGYRLGPFQQVGLGHGLLALAVAIASVPYVELGRDTLTPLVWALILVSLGYQEWTGPHESADPSMRQVAFVLVLMSGLIIGLGFVMAFLA